MATDEELDRVLSRSARTKAHKKRVEEITQRLESFNDLVAGLSDLPIVTMPRQPVRNPTPAPTGAIFRPLTEDFITIEWEGRRFELPRMAAAAVKVLYQAWKSGAPEMPQQAVLKRIKSKNSRLHDVFRGTGLWNALVVPGERLGTRRLNLPDPRA